MALDNFSEKLAIKNILFTKSLPNYSLPIASNGYKTFACRDCGDKFLFESSYNDHINRKSLKITFSCKYCNNKNIICNNRCRFLSHIRSHSFKTTTINVNDVKIEPLPIQDINWTVLPKKNDQVETQGPIKKPDYTKNHCYECKQILGSNINPQDRAKHYMKYTNKVYSCPICLFALPNACSLTAHLRIHLRIPPYYCPECGDHLVGRSNIYPYNHYCEGFNMIRATTRLKCNDKNCNKIFHPNNYKMHLKNHIKKVYKCDKCLMMWYEESKKKHNFCEIGFKITSFLQCQLCSSKLKEKVNNHINWHFREALERFKAYIYPCLSCSLMFIEICSLIKHQINVHAPSELKILLSKILNQYECNPKDKTLYSVTKKCDKCLRSFIYRCQYENIKILPNECPYKCSAIDNVNILANNETIENLPLICHLCKRKMSENWKDIKNHYAKFHKNHKCIDVKVVLPRINNKHILSKSKECLSGVMKKSLKKRKKLSRKSNIEQTSGAITNNVTADNIVCNICNFKCQDKQTFEAHIITHRDPCMAYQCLECGQCFVVKPSFSTHLLIKHGIANFAEYIDKKSCYNELALLKQPNNLEVEDEPVKENQCKICRDQFDNNDDLEKHFRVHGMAFLMKNTNKNSP